MLCLPLPVLPVNAIAPLVAYEPDRSAGGYQVVYVNIMRRSVAGERL